MCSAASVQVTRPNGKGALSSTWARREHLNKPQLMFTILYFQGFGSQVCQESLNCLPSASASRNAFSTLKSASHLNNTTVKMRATGMCDLEDIPPCSDCWSNIGRGVLALATPPPASSKAPCTETAPLRPLRGQTVSLGPQELENPQNIKTGF